MKCIEFFPVVVLTYPQDEDHAPILEEQCLARVAKAEDVCEGDLILAEFDTRGRSDYFNDQYAAATFVYDPTCECGVCCHVADLVGPVVVLSEREGFCDPWPADALVLIIPDGQQLGREAA
ncbi:hypothetical protein ABCR94_38920 [Streptomyces sp. 21So2-11]|uniref:hypothetical protein n=1 Tax=Streptomyces sp. 21So2-11 TaxID=3144408 RepID=UPI00321A64C6